MAQFRATIQGARGLASRLGTKSSGLVVEANGWTTGVRVEADYDADSGTDSFTIYATTGSSQRRKRVPIARLIGETIQVYADGAWRTNGEWILGGGEELA